MYCFGKFCLICTMETTNLIYLYKRSELDICTNYFDMLQVLYPKLIELNSNFPEFICKSCLKELINSYSFYQKCQKAEKILKNYLQRLFIPEQNKKRKINYDVETSWDFFDNSKRMKFSETIESSKTFCSKNLEHLDVDLKSSADFSDSTTVIRGSSEKNSPNNSVRENDDIFLSSEEILLKYIESNAFELSITDTEKIFDLNKELCTEKLPAETKNTTTEIEVHIDSDSEFETNSDNTNLSLTETSENTDLDSETPDTNSYAETYTQDIDIVEYTSDFSESNYTEIEEFNTKTSISTLEEIKNELLEINSDTENSQCFSSENTEKCNTKDDIPKILELDIETTENTYCAIKVPEKASEKLNKITENTDIYFDTVNSSENIALSTERCAENTEIVFSGNLKQKSENTTNDAETSKEASAEKNTICKQIIDIPEIVDTLVNTEKPEIIVISDAECNALTEKSIEYLNPETSFIINTENKSSGSEQDKISLGFPNSNENSGSKPVSLENKNSGSKNFGRGSKVFELQSPISKIWNNENSLSQTVFQRNPSKQISNNYRKPFSSQNVSYNPNNFYYNHNYWNGRDLSPRFRTSGFMAGYYRYQMFPKCQICGLECTSQLHLRSHNFYCRQKYFY